MKHILSEVRNKINSINDETATHLYRTSELVKEFGEFLNLTDTEISNLTDGAMLHDLGKYEIPQEVLYKKGKLTDDEFLIMKSHVLKATMVLDMGKFEENIVDIILQHHERPDGKGYPYGLKSENINKLSKIFSLIDVFDALTTERAYKKAMNIDETLILINKGLGTQFDKEIGLKFVNFVLQRANTDVNSSVI
jgi:HD-GYP domain